MKKLILAVMVMVFTLAATESKAQNWDEWFRQKKTQKKYLIQQIAALQVYIGYAQKGYKIAQKGLQTIGGNTGGELDLHADHFDSLSLVNPKIKQHPRVSEIKTMRNRIIYEYHSTYEQLRSSNTFSSGELEYVRIVYNRLLKDCQYSIDQLDAIGSDHLLVMTDAERIERINLLYEDMKDKYAFSKSFADDARVIALSRLQEKKEIETSRELNGIKSGSK